jgi:hypothetical protein
MAAVHLQVLSLLDFPSPAQSTPLGVVTQTLEGHWYHLSSWLSSVLSLD